MVSDHIKIWSDLGDNDPLTNVKLKLWDDAKCENVTEGIPVVCAMALVKYVHHDAIMPVDVVADLEHLPIIPMRMDGSGVPDYKLSDVMNANQ